jgi:hypothetical protein
MVYEKQGSQVENSQMVGSFSAPLPYFEYLGTFPAVVEGGQIPVAPCRRGTGVTDPGALVVDGSTNGLLSESNVHIKYY